MANVDYFAGADPFASHQPRNGEPYSVEWWLEHFDPDAGRKGLTPDAFDNWAKARDIIAERQRLAEERATEQRAAQRQAAQERVPYSDAIANEICERIASGELLTCICRDAHMPTARRVVQFLKQNPDFNLLYNSALQDRLTIFEEQMVEFADSLPREPQRAIARNTKEKIQFPDHVQKAKLQIEVRWRHLKAGRPQKWAEQSTLNIKETDPFADVANLSDEELARIMKELDEKESVRKDGPHFRPFNEAKSA